jgi:hypothetical protein
MSYLSGRGISEKFIEDLKIGSLQPILNAVLRNDTLCLEIREGYINLYYRGGNLLRITQSASGYTFAFDLRYCEHKTGRSENASRILNAKTITDYVDLIPLLKTEMDWYFCEHPKMEREIQQHILRENNRCGKAKHTDYFIADIEYANMQNGSRFDMLAVKWPSTSLARKNSNDLSLAFIEVKYGDSALNGTAGLKKHFTDMESFLRNHSLSQLSAEAQKVMNQKVELGLVSGIKEDKKICINPNKRPEFILLLANHEPASTILERDLAAIVESDTYKSLSGLADVKIAASSMMGYGLFEGTMRSIESYIYDRL